MRAGVVVNDTAIGNNPARAKVESRRATPRTRVEIMICAK